ncbi:hypothetical protein FIBSPDRAFT_718277, partial [Athelia psychrophila]
MTQIVNALTSKMEMGGPMAAMYLLGNPDHYTSHHFVSCYWKNYTRFITSQWDVDDYKFRPAEFEDVPLYTWVRLMVKSPLSARAKQKRSEEVAPSSSDSEEGQGCSGTAGRFMGTHPDRKSHSVTLMKDDKTRVPEFLGGPLPRHDRGDREDYCMTMLALFKPWRTGVDLK